MTQRVRTSLLADSVVTGNKIGTTAVSTNNIVAGAITGNLIGTAITGNLSAAISSNHIADLAVTGNELGLNSVSSNNIANSAVTNAKLAEPNAFEDYFLLGLGS
jgi:hypothetical protein